MLVKDTNVIKGGNVLSVGTEGGIVKIVLKNNSSLSLIPVVEAGVVVGFGLDYLTGKECKKIDSLQKKIDELQNDISEIRQNGLAQSKGEDDTDSGSEDPDSGNEDEEGTEIDQELLDQERERRHP